MILGFELSAAPIAFNFQESGISAAVMNKPSVEINCYVIAPARIARQFKRFFEGGRYITHAQILA